MRLAGCEILREALCGCRAVLLAASEAEARPLRDALLRGESYTVATKEIEVGEIEPKGPGAAGPLPDCAAVKVVVGVSGCDKANVAHLLTCMLQAMSPLPELVLQAGIGGGFAGEGTGQSAPSGQTGRVGRPVRVGDVVIATSEAYSDTGSSSPAGWLSAAELGLAIARPGDAELGGVFPLDLALAEAARAAIAAGGSSSSAGGSGESVLLLGRCITSSCVTGRADEAEAGARRWGPLAESMEGAAAAHISALYGVPFLEIRGISNLVTNRDRESWQVERAIAVAGRAAIAVVGALDQLPLGLG